MQYPNTHLEPGARVPHWRGASAIPLWRRERLERRETRERNRRLGRTTPRLAMIALVELDTITVPSWARKKAIKGLTLTDHSVWLRRIAANLLARLDSEAGGTPRLTPVAYRRCGICRRPLLGLDAEARLELDMKFEGRRIACGPDCCEVAQNQRSARRNAKRNEQRTHDYQC